MSPSCQLQLRCCDCNGASLPDIRSFRRECQPNEYYNTFCTLCGTGMGYSSKSLNKHEDGHKHRQLNKTKKTFQKQWSETRHLLNEEFCCEIFESRCWVPEKFKSIRKTIMRLVDTNMLIFKPWALKIKAAIWDWGHHTIELWECEDRCKLIAFKEIMALVQLGFLRKRLSYEGDVLQQDTKAKISRLIATEGHIIMNRIYQFVGNNYSWSKRCFV